MQRVARLSSLVVLLAATVMVQFPTLPALAKGKPGPGGTYARDGSGSATTPTVNVLANSTVNTIVLTYTAASGGMSNGVVTIAVPSGWSPPSIGGSDPGFTTASTGTVAVSVQVITVSGVTLSGGSSVVVTYGSTGSGGPGATAPGPVGVQTWGVQQKSTPSGTLTSLASSPSILVAILLPPFHTEGNLIKDAKGNPVIMRGIERELTEKGTFPNDAEIGQIRSWGANIVRIPLSESLWLNTCASSLPSNDPTYPGAVDAEVKSVTSRGMVALIELNFNVTRLCGTPGPQPMADAQFSGTFWQQVASRYKGNEWVAFDLYNEPHDITDQVWLNGGQVSTGALTFDAEGMQQMYTVVRNTGATNLIFVSGEDWADRPATTLVSGSNVVNAVHDYTCPEYPPPQCTTQNPYDPSPILNHWLAVGLIQPMMVTEFGWPDKQDGTYNANLIADSETDGWGWIVFAFTGTSNGLFDLITDTATYNPAPAGVPVKNGLAKNG